MRCKQTHGYFVIYFVIYFVSMGESILAVIMIVIVILQTLCRPIRYVLSAWSVDKRCICILHMGVCPEFVPVPMPKKPWIMNRTL